MKNRILFSMFLTIFSFVFTVSAKQEKYTKHTVVKGETINIIAQKHKITPYEIYKLNPDSQNGIQQDIVLLIQSSAVETTPSVAPKLTSSTNQNSNLTDYLLQPKVTLYSLSKQYNITIDELKAANGNLLKEGLKIRQKK